MEEQKLSNRVAELVAPCRETDAETAVAIGWFRAAPNKGWPVLVDYIDICGKQEVHPGNGFDQLVPHFTASLDASIKLVPEGWFMSVQTVPQNQGYARLCDTEGTISAAHAATPAIALCAAALKAKGL